MRMGFIAFASMVFYASHIPHHLILLLSMSLTTFGFGLALARKKSRLLLTAGICANVFALIYFKYKGFVIDNYGQFFGIVDYTSTLLPLAISFFVFQKIAFLVDVYQGKTKETNVIRFMVFAFFFPQLIAGPIVHHLDVRGQYDSFGKLKSFDISVGLTFFFIGLFKKVVVADPFGGFADTVFAAAQAGNNLSVADAWLGALAFSLQIYFDFSGYTDMAVGLARMLGILLPMNFNSPYRALSIIDFWRRWHITLSQFLRDYIYIPLGGKECSQLRQALNVVVVMLIGGLWHGAGWTFVLWGMLHGFYLAINHAWRRYAGRVTVPVPLSLIFTYACVVLAWVLFRATDMGSALVVWKSMLGFTSKWGPESLGAAEWFRVLVGMAFVWFLPNIQTMMGYWPDRYNPHRISAWPWPDKVAGCWRPGWGWAIIVALAGSLGMLSLSSSTQFIYFAF